MIGTRERSQQNTGYSNYGYQPKYFDDCYSEKTYDNNYDNYQDNAQYQEENVYNTNYDNYQMNNQRFNCASDEYTFRPIELSDIESDVKTKSKSKTRAKINMSIKSKIMVGVYFALVSLIVVMLLVNALPGVKAQNANVESQSKEVVNEQVLNEEAGAVASQSGLVKGDGYTYDTETNWFDKFCDSFSGLFN